MTPPASARATARSESGLASPAGAPHPVSATSRPPVGVLPCESGPLTPAALRARFGLSEGARRRLAQARSEIAELVLARDPRLLVVVGPCSLHDPASALEYGQRLSHLADELQDDLVVVMRAYLEKPRSSVGWKGLVNDPWLDGSQDLERGLAVGRQLLCDLAELGLPLAAEVLDLNLSAYLADLVAWVAIGARTTESQPHRELASSLEVCAGFKNGTDGSLDGALGGLVAASHSHVRLAADDAGALAIQRSPGNPRCHVILRGGSRGPNYDEASVARAGRLAEERALPGRVLVDCSHGNSGKDHRRQPVVAREVARQVSAGSRHVLGVMIESHLLAGSQPLDRPLESLRYGQSVTDACIDFETTADLLRELARARRSGSVAAP